MSAPILPSEIRADFARIFARADVVILHAAARAIGPVAGGIEGVFAALIDALEDRTLLVPTFTTTHIDPSAWDPPVDPARWDAIRAELPLFDPDRSPPHGMGRLVDLVLRAPGAIRSTHPVESVAAIGPHARALVRPHPIDDPMGPRSPWARAVALDARIVLLGVGLERCSIVHHAERLFGGYALARPYLVPALDEAGERTYVEVDGGSACSEGFPALEPELHAHGVLEEATVGHARTRLLGSRATVEIAIERLRRETTALLCTRPGCASCRAARAAVGAAP
jgi:aminoglycoside 3-N-acetyltransferase